MVSAHARKVGRDIENNIKRKRVKGRARPTKKKRKDNREEGN